MGCDVKEIGFLKYIFLSFKKQIVFLTYRSLPGLLVYCFDQVI